MVTSHLFTLKAQILILDVVRAYISISQYLYWIYVLTYNLSKDFFFVGKRIVLTNDFVKKSMITPKSAIELAVKYKNDYIERYT